MENDSFANTTTATMFCFSGHENCLIDMVMNCDTALDKLPLSRVWIAKIKTEAERRKSPEYQAQKKAEEDARVQIIARKEALVNSALAKLTNEECEALRDHFANLYDE